MPELESSIPEPRGHLGDVVVIELGYNDNPEATTKTIDRSTLDLCTVVAW